MSFLRRGERRRGKVATAATTVVALAAFQALAIVGAGSAFAITDCDFTLSTGAVGCTIDPGNSLYLTVESTADLDPLAAPGSILQSVNGGVWEAIGSASNANTTKIDIKGSNGTNEVFVIVNGPSAAFSVAPWGDEFATSIAWSVDLGTGTADAFYIFGSDDLDDEIVGTDTSFLMNGGGGPIAGMEQFWAFPGDGDDTVDNSALTANVITVIFGDTGDDWIAPGLYDGDVVSGDAGVDQLSYGTRTTSTVIDNVTGTSGFDANADCDVLDASDEFDLQSLFEVKETGSGNDCLIGVTAVDETFIPGDGNDDITGNVADVPPPAGSGDTIDYSSSSAAMTIDPGAGTATGQGDDTFTDVLGFIGSDFDDTLLWNSAVWGFAGGGGIDTVDASAKTTAQVIDLDLLDDLLTADSTENAIGGSGDDFLGGNDLRNVLTGNDGNDFLEGWGGNDTMFGGLGNDDFWGGLGADTVDFGASPAKIEADVQVGFASGEGDDSFSDFPEIVKGSAFNDTITGGGGIISINFRFTGRNGKDLLTGSGSNDTLKGGKGNDKLRGLEGGDTLVGGKGTNDKAWGGPGTDVCKGVEWERSCEI